MPALKAEYIWIDGSEPTPRLRSKTKIVEAPDMYPDMQPSFPNWGFDGSSTGQADGSDSDCILDPVYVCTDPLRQNGYLVLCEVYGSDKKPHPTNHRHALQEVALEHNREKAWFGFEQEYTMFRGRRPLGWPEGGYPAPQGPFYCGVGADEVFGRQIVEEHLEACIEAGLTISGVNAEVMPGQWEFQIGPVDAETGPDQLIMARYLLYRIAENHGVTISLHPKPIRGDWNGAGCHTNFSTKDMRALQASDRRKGIEHINDAIAKLEERHQLHIEHYGTGIEQRLTGQHETCSYKEFRWGVADRGASVRIPLNVSQDGHGYLEDRRPCANIDPYTVARLLLETVCG